MANPNMKTSSVSVAEITNTRGSRTLYNNLPTSQPMTLASAATLPASPCAISWWVRFVALARTENNGGRIHRKAGMSSGEEELIDSIFHAAGW
jgi:hypothetical protein